MPKLFEGKVVSVKNLNTVVVSVVSQHVHPVYKKILNRNKKYKVHYTGGQVVEGETVQFAETRPISRDKKYKLIKTVRK